MHYGSSTQHRLLYIWFHIAVLPGQQRRGEGSNEKKRWGRRREHRKLTKKRNYEEKDEVKMKKTSSREEIRMREEGIARAGKERREQIAIKKKREHEGRRRI